MPALRNLSYFQKSVAVIIFFTVLRIILSFFLELGNDESYYWTYADRLQWNYFDHPPLVGVWIKFFTLNLLLDDHVFFIRLGSFISCALSSFFIYKTIATISSERAGLIGVFLYNISFYATISAGTIMTPDVPQMVFWTLSMYMIAKIFEDVNRWKYWLLFGLSAGLCIMSKVHGVFLWGGLFLYAIFYMRELFFKKQVYVAALMTIIVISPILIWNIQNDFITYRFHSDRVIVDKETTLHWLGLLREMIGQVLVNNPFLIALVFIFLFSKKALASSVSNRVFKFIALPLLGIIFLIALFRQSLPHWSGPVYVTLLPMAAIGLAQLSLRTATNTVRWAFTYTGIFLLLLIYAVNFYPGTFGQKTEPYLGKGDISLDAYGWREAGGKFGILYKNNAGTGKPPLVCNDLWGAHEEYYFARPLNVPMIGLGTVNALHHYAWRNKYTIPKTNMDTAFCIVHSDEYYDPRKAYAGYYSTIDSITTINILRGNKPAHNFYVYRLSGWQK